MTIDEKLPQVKEVELEILTVVDKFCRDNHLKYTLAYGTLLGAVRHKGFIPWDDDIDICMPREDYDKFIKLWLANPVDGYIIQNPYLEPDFTQNFTKIRKNNTTFLQLEEERNKSYHKGIFVDIFPLDRIAANKFEVKMQSLYAMFMMLYTRKFIPPNEKGITRLVSKFALSIVPKSKYDSIKLKLEKAIIKRSSASGGYCCFGSTSSLTTEPYSNSMFDKLEETGFEGRMVYVTANKDEVLTKTYGDYMKFPPKEKRVWAHHPILIDFEKNYEDLQV